MKNRNKNFNIPNTLTLLRILLIIPFVLYYIQNQTVKAAVVLILSGLTDLLDGQIARRFNQSTELGQMLDPLSDKLTQGAVAVCLAVKEPATIPFLVVLLIKELTMVLASIFLIRKNKRPGGSKWYGKTATVLFYISFGIIVSLKGIWGYENPVLSVSLLTITGACMIYAFIRYAKVYFTIIRSDDPQYKMDIQEVMDKKRS